MNSSRRRMVEKMTVEKITDGEVGVVFTLGDQRKATSSCFAKLVTGVNTEKRNGYAFEGRFINSGDVIKVPAYVVLVRGEGSWKHPHNHIYLYRVTEEGAELLYDGSWDDNKDKAKAVLAIAEHVNAQKKEETTAIIVEGFLVASQLPSPAILQLQLSGRRSSIRSQGTSSTN